MSITVRISREKQQSLFKNKDNGPKRYAREIGWKLRIKIRLSTAFTSFELSIHKVFHNCQVYKHTFLGHNL